VAKPSSRSAYRAVLALAVVIIGILAVAFVFLVPLGDSRSDGDVINIAGHPLLGEEAPQIDLVTLDGERMTLSELQGRPVLINFWATWCIPCREEFPLMVAMYEEHTDAGLEILGVVHDDSEDGARRFATDLGATWPMPFDADDVAWNDYLGVAMPTSFFVDADGVIRAFSLGGFTETGLEAQLATILPET
jgi:cytochrome c biogenesis protein CcmG/thiol:disulfide interchange protein DsbE